MLSILCVRLTIKVKVGIPESLKVGWYPPKKTGSSHLKENMLYLISRFSLTSNQKSLVFRGTEALSDIVNVFVPAPKLSGNFSFIRLTDHFLLFFLAFKSTLVVPNKHVTFFL